MPWSPNDADKFKKGLGEAAKRRWARIANSSLQQHGDEGKAIRIANGVVRRSAGRRMDRKIVSKRGY